MRIFFKLTGAFLAGGILIGASVSVRAQQEGGFQEKHKTYFVLSGFFLRASVACGGDPEKLIKLSGQTVSSRELKVFAAAFPKTVENWMINGAETFNAIALKDGIQTACGPALEFFRDKTINVLKSEKRSSSENLAQPPPVTTAKSQIPETQKSAAVDWEALWPGLLLLLTLIGIYFFPSYYAAKRDHANAKAILVLNLFLGWTLLGWIAALVWAATDNVRDNL